MKKILILGFILLLSTSSYLRSQNNDDELVAPQVRSDCWKSDTEITLLDTLRSAMTHEIEDRYKNHNFIQTFGCAYEETDIEKNSIKAVYRAIIQSVMNRKVTLRDDILNLLSAKPPRPDNLTRDYVIYVNLPIGADIKAARYEIKILDIEAISTIESEMSVWTRIITRFAYKEDYNNAAPPESTQSHFVEVMETAQNVLKASEDRDFSDIENLLEVRNRSVATPGKISELIFGDTMEIFNPQDPGKSYLAVFLGKGIYACDIPGAGVVVCKFGDERLFDLLIDANSFRRTSTSFASLDYEAPESILKCLLLKFSSRKPEELPYTIN